MDRMLVAVFDNETQAYEGKRALLQLDSEGSIGVYGYASVKKNPDGSSTVKQSDEDVPLGTLAGTSLGALVGILGGPAGMAIGATLGMSAGLTADVYNAGVGEDYLDDVAKALSPGKVAVVAEIEEDWTTPVDTRMEAIGGVVFRRTVAEVKDKIHQEDVAAIKADIAQLKAERATAVAQRKTKLSEKISLLDSKLQSQLQKAKERREAADREAKAKAEFLSAKAAAARGRASV